MVIFLDTSAIYALSDRNDLNHSKAKQYFNEAIGKGHSFLVHNYILLESAALLSGRLGWPAAFQFMKDSENFDRVWVDQELHQEAVKKWSHRAKRKVSFVDQVSFFVMRENHIEKAFTFDDDFINEGFSLWALNS